ncbi:MAG TPA: hypothetical protein VGH42_12775 [Verrucomicrobiae bacterium]|jgi:hypothetical protein
MKKVAHCICLICVLTLLGVSVLRAKDLAATAASKSAEATRTPAIFRFCSGATNALANEFLAGFADARSNFSAAVQDAFHRAPLDDQTIASPDFGYLITAFNIKNKNFPITADLAATWARGNPDLAAQNRLLDFLLLTMQHAVRPDDLPENFTAGETVRLVPVNDPNEKLTLADAETRGQLVAESNVTTLSQLQIIFRREFASDDEQPLARALATLLKPNCFPDAELTQLARAQVNEKLAGSPGQQMIAGHDVPHETQPALPAVNLAQNDSPKKLEQTIALQNQPLKIPARNNLFFSMLVAISIAALLMLWRWISRRQRVSLLPARTNNFSPQNPVVLHADLAPHLAQVVKEALVQELAVQRRELLVAQQMATAEIIGLVRRLDELQMTMQERVQTYETQIEKLERELAARTEENHELLKLKIEMIRQQLETERTRSRMNFN